MNLLAAASAGESWVIIVVYVVIIIGFMYFLAIKPQKKQEKKHRERHSGGHQRIRNRIIAENESEYHTEDQTDQARTSAGEETEDILLQRIKFACDRQ